MLSRIFGIVADVFFPARCLVCRAPGAWWCVACRASVECLSHNRCPGCGKSLFEHSCEQDILRGLAVTGFYHDKRLREAIQALKYHGVTKIMPQVEAYLKAWRDVRLDPWPWAGESSLVVQHLPAAPRHVRKRGFDQARLIRDALIRSCLPWGKAGEILVRRGKARSQTELSVELRRANVAGCFALARDATIPPAVLLVDDVFTSGATMREAARALKAAGVERIYGFALAVGS
ncbi:MAG: double zinc ribbon domain-containing protein [Patescibacteria group bacterium]